MNKILSVVTVEVLEDLYKESDQIADSAYARGYMEEANFFGGRASALKEILDSLNIIVCPFCGQRYIDYGGYYCHCPYCGSK